MRIRRIMVLLFVAFLLAGVPALAQEGPAWQVSAADALVLQSGVGMRIFPSPDGQQVAYDRTVRLNGHRDYYACVASVVDPQEPLCLEPPEALPRGFDPDPGSYFVPFGWSPDGARLAVVGQPYITSSDTDLWVMDLAAGTWERLVDDGYDGPLVATADQPGPPPGVIVQVQPTWSPDGTQIAVEQTVTGEDGGLGRATLSVVDAATGAVRDLAPLPGSEAHTLDAGSTSSLAWSPDGASLAVAVRHREADPDHDGVWLVDVERGEWERLVSLTVIEEALQSLYAGTPLESLGPLFWSPDGERLLLWAGNPNSRPVAVWVFWVALESGEITAVPLPAHPRDTDSRRTIWPFQAAWSPDGAALLVAANGVHPDDPEVPLDPESRRVRVSLYLVDVEAGEAHLLGQLPVGPVAPLYLAAWGEGGDAILDGYHLALQPR